MENEISILIVEDEAIIAETIKIQLQNFGYNVKGVCYNFNNALKAINETQFDVLITDINLGNGTDEKSGLQIAQLVKDKKNCPIIFLTAFSDIDTIKKASALLPSAYLIKPINAPNLFAAVQLAVNNFTQQIAANSQKPEVPNYFFVKQGNKLLKLFWQDVYHLESVKNYVKIQTTIHSSHLLLRGSLNQVLQKMIPIAFKNSFIKINRAEVVAKTIIVKVNDDNIETKYGTFEIGSGFDRKEL